MADWYDQGYAAVIEGAAREADITDEEAKAVYRYLEGVGLIDYDVEKEVFYDLVGDDEDEEDEE